MIRRQKFFIRGNVHLKFIFSYVAVLAGGIFAAVYLIYLSSNDIVEKASFSSHLAFSSTGELFYRAIMQTNLMIAAIIALIGMVLIASAHFYLEFFFRSLAQALDRLAKGDYSFRLKIRGGWLFSGLIKNFNSLIEKMDEESKERIRLIDTLLEAPDFDAVDIGKIRAIHAKLLELSALRETSVPTGEVSGSAKALL